MTAIIDDHAAIKRRMHALGRDDDEPPIDWLLEGDNIGFKYGTRSMSGTITKGHFHHGIQEQEASQPEERGA